LSVNEHWLARKSTLRILWRAFFVALALTVLAELFVAHEPLFALEGVFGFGALYGFVACAALILLARAMGLALKRPETYYGEDHGAD
jgi:hypothetical protein